MNSVPSNKFRNESELRWVESESIRLILQERRGTNGLAVMGMLLVVSMLYMHVNIWIVLTWLLLSAGALLAHIIIKAFGRKQLAQAGLEVKSAYILKFSVFWALTAFIWGSSDWLVNLDIPVQNQYVCLMVLNIVGFAAVHNLTPHRKIASQFINVLMGTQIVGVMWKIGFVHHFNSPEIQYVHLIVLIVFWIVLRVLDNRFYYSFKRDVILQHRNNELIKSLRRKTEQLEHEKQVALNANETIKRFYSSAAHDIRQPVYALNVYADLVSDDPTQTLTMVPKIKAACKAINALFHSLFDFEKIHAGQISVSLQSIDLANVFEDVKKNYQPLAHAKNIELRVLPTSGFLQSDPALLKGILYHLVSNAIKYTNHGGVLLTMRKNEHSISFEVWDTGIGIDPMQQTHVFKEFFKVNEQSSADEGFGLGLSVVKRLAAFVEGSSVTLQSRVGRGSVFKFRVPLSAYIDTNSRHGSNKR